MNTDIVAVVKNMHVEGCGEPPNLKSEEFDYFAVFQNEHDEQTVLVREKHPYGLGAFVVYSGDGGWEEAHRLEGPIALTSLGFVDVPTVGNLILNENEEKILTALIRAATAHDETKKKRQEEARG